MSKSPDAFRTIREVADWLGVAPHVLRFWESKFSQIRPVKRAGGRRYYRPADMELVGGIKVLLHDRGMTIRGAQRMIREEGVAAVMALSPSPDESQGPSEPIEGIAEETAWQSDAGAEIAEAGAEPSADDGPATESKPEPDLAPESEPELDLPPQTAPEPASPAPTETPAESGIADTPQPAPVEMGAPDAPEDSVENQAAAEAPTEVAGQDDAPAPSDTIAPDTDAPKPDQPDLTPADALDRLAQLATTRPVPAETLAAMRRLQQRLETPPAEL
ncbi:MerR family transcriptional regulator [Roseibacterium beibuensis]|uniref:MerR family transcriptional regulator n=1 Tax=[Roseibacterium] beibuensis TaxID=1193142 RepID=A0ABP9LHS4_9RHOB|nr:MerR family transcriptional regulator [Roseibacterium beibuensis]MCS6625916.1 MerR family transcriptional regulator [Roseibacterium beibuensis]